MPVYEYKALDKAGKNCKGIIDADSTGSARKKLRARGHYPISIQENSARSRRKEGGKQVSLRFFDRITSKEIHIFTRQLATLLGARIPLVPSLSSLISQTENPAFKKIIAQIKESVNEGKTLTNAMAEHPRVFSNIYLNMIRAGEASGSLDIVMEKLADFGEKQEALKGKLTAALIYPCVMALICIGVLFILITYIIPNITQVFVEMDRILPLPTRILIGMSDFLIAYWFVVAALAVLVIVAGRFFIQSKRGRYLWDYILLKLPVVGTVLQKIILARFSSTLGSLLESGVGLIASMEIVKTIMNNSRISQVVDEAIVQIREGKSMTISLSNSPWFPPMFVQMVGVGEQAGTLEKMLRKVADAYEREVESAVLGMTALIEPIMIVLMGGIVGVIILSILLPIFEMNQMIG
ncbi:MAG: type II secretion system inner membrane protein GspF [Desulfopila sp.]|jgi:general secretion pathway protein F|nr:type II secretion system inner membrane protein GspF [Desulfopila sp.]